MLKASWALHEQLLWPQELRCTTVVVERGGGDLERGGRAGRPASYILPTGETKDQALTRLRDMAASLFMGLYLKDLPQPGSSLSWDQGVAYARYRYGIPQLNVADPMQPNRLKLCSCSTEDVQHSLDLSGRHQVLCPKGPWSTTSRHAHTTNAVARSLSGRVRHYRR